MPGLLLPLSGIGNSLRAEPGTLAAGTTSVYVVPPFLTTSKQNQALQLYSQVQFICSYLEKTGEKNAVCLPSGRIKNHSLK